MLSDRLLQHLQDVAEMPHFDGDRYVNLRRVGSGGMGTVFCADDTLLNRKVAIKVQAATEEARIIAGLEHPGIVPVHDLGTLDDGRIWYAMKFVDGQTLAQFAQSASLPRLLHIVRQTCDAVAFAHARGVVHRDLKPQNIMVGSFGETLVMDWGVARTIGEDAEPSGTRGYSAPEQLAGARPDPRADVYALGRVLAFVLPEHAPRALEAIASKASAENAADRYSDASALSDDLARWLDGLAVQAHRETPIELAARWLANNRTIAALVGAYIVMRIVLFVFTRH
ncbi:MAG TPA: serine/threonine-protein kinase [Thermoanaerobaculia bacterium]|nr:serine/threonine-protein kinase [Thermoanaerobaculia bacterium]